MNRDIPQNNREKRFEQLRLKKEMDRVAALDEYYSTEIPPQSLSHSERIRVHLGKVRNG